MCTGYEQHKKRENDFMYCGRVRAERIMKARNISYRSSCIGRSEPASIKEDLGHLLSMFVRLIEEEFLRRVSVKAANATRGGNQVFYEQNHSNRSTYSNL